MLQGNDIREHSWDKVALVPFLVQVLHLGHLQRLKSPCLFGVFRVWKMW